VIAVTGRYYSSAADTMVFVVMVLVILKEPLLNSMRRLVGRRARA
jgi:hypothetical protein